MRGGGFNPYFGGMMMMPMQPMYYRGGRGRAFRYVCGGVVTRSPGCHGSTFIEEVWSPCEAAIRFILSLSLSPSRGRAKTNWYAPY